MTYFEFRELASALKGDVRIDYIRNGKQHSVHKQDTSAAEAEVFEPHPWWTRKFLAFRRLPNHETAMPCKW